MKKGLIGLILLVSCLIFSYVIFLSVRDMNKPGKEGLLDGKDISKEEYIYKDDLLDLGYSIDEVNTIQNKLSLSDVKAYILNKSKINNLTSIVNNPYFKVSNIDRYESYYEKNPNYTLDQVILYVEIGLDNPFYTNIYAIYNYDKITAILNKYNKLPEEVMYEDLVNIPKPYSNDGKKTIRSVVYDDLIKMIDDAKEEGIKLFVISGYRTWKNQEYLFKNSKQEYADAGHSEHQLGLAVDFNSNKNSFKKSKQYEWLKNNAYKYGFIERYPESKEFITGYSHMPWHYRYVGIEASTKIYENSITFEEYYVRYNK